MRVSTTIPFPPLNVTVDEFCNPVNPTDEITQINQTNQINDLSHPNRINRTNRISQMNQLNPINPLHVLAPSLGPKVVFLSIEMFSPVEKTPETFPVLGGSGDASQPLSQRFRVRGEGESQIVEVLGSNATKGLPIHGCHLMFEQHEHLEEGRRTRLSPNIRRKTPECIEYPQVPAYLADVREGIECPLGFLAKNALNGIQSIND